MQLRCLTYWLTTHPSTRSSVHCLALPSRSLESRCLMPWARAVGTLSVYSCWIFINAADMGRSPSDWSSSCSPASPSSLGSRFRYGCISTANRCGPAILSHAGNCGSIPMFPCERRTKNRARVEKRCYHSLVAPHSLYATVGNTHISRLLLLPAFQQTKTFTALRCLQALLFATYRSNG